MASNYAHYKFGHLAVEKSSQRVKDIVSCATELFNVGVHGPDILFYYKPYKNPVKKNEISSKGYGLHKKTGLEVFSSLLPVAKADEEKAYLLGFLTHFVLDTAVHSYIERQTEKGILTHIEMENEFDRELLSNDGFNPLREKLTHLNPSDKNCELISKFWEGVAPQKIKKAIRSMIFCTNSLVTENTLKRGAIKAMFGVTGHYKQLHGLLINKKPNPDFKESTKELQKRFDSSVKIAAQLMDELLSEKLDNKIFSRVFSDNGCDL